MYNAVGGSTIHWQGIFPRFHPSDFKVKTLDGVADDWPISYKDLEPYYSEAKVFVIPEKQAGGLKIKSVEAALNKVPIVSSSFGVSGTEFLNMRDCITCKLTAESFAESIIRLLESESLQAEISNNAYEKALKLFSKTAVELKWKSFWNRVF